MKWISSLLVCFVIFFAAASIADTDYLCLKSCMNNNGSYASCMPQCTYNTVSPSSSHGATSNGSSHDIFKAITSGDKVLQKPAQAAAPSTHIDYDCRNQCMQQGLQYPLCTARCTKSFAYSK